MRILQSNPDLTQREIAQLLGVSASGLNYCLNALIDKKSVPDFKQAQAKADATLPLNEFRQDRRLYKNASRFAARSAASQCQARKASRHAHVHPAQPHRGNVR
jgi:hypothetical protein